MTEGIFANEMDEEMTLNMGPQHPSTHGVLRLELDLDGEIVRVGAPEALVKMKFGGVDPGNMQFATGVQGEFNKMAGNIDLMAGIAPQSGTAKQDEILTSASSAMESKRIGQVAPKSKILFVTIHSHADVVQEQRSDGIRFEVRCRK